ncbi:MAG: hypothetical protein AB7R55_21515 [Gemmatimonadales bacterium]
MSAVLLVLAPVGGVSAQVLPVDLALGSPGKCDADALEARLLSAHPLGAAASPGAVCPTSDRFAWVPSSRMSPEERGAFRRAVDELVGDRMGVCRATGLAMRNLDRADRVRVWVEPDTAQGFVYYGATYVTPDAVPLAVHFWSAAFTRSAEWLVAAVAHEGYHAIRPEASEAEAVQMGRSCAIRGAALWSTAGFGIGGGR